MSGNYTLHKYVSFNNSKFISDSLIGIILLYAKRFAYLIIGDVNFCLAYVAISFHCELSANNVKTLEKLISLSEKF